MKLRSIIIVSLILTTLWGCNSDKPKPLNTTDMDISSLQSEVYRGDIESYKKLKITYLDYSPEHLLFWAMIMANKYDYGPAYLDVYYSIEDSYSRGGEAFKSKDKITKQLQIEYLTKASQKGEKQADELLIELQK